VTTQEIIDYYADLLILQYRGKEKAYAHIQTLVENVIMDQLPDSVQNGFDIETAVGDQLDFIGKYVGVSRTTYTFTQAITLDDDDFRTYIKVGILKNNAGSSLFEIQELLNIYFPDSIFVFDFKNMTLSYIFDSALGSRPLAEVFVRSGFLPKPMGVAITAVIYTSNVDNIYGWRSYERDSFNVTPFNNYVDYDENAPWIDYNDAIFG
jgi:hypothetical protein